MPMYEYECESCGGRFEVVQKFSDPPLNACTRCGSANVKKLLSPAAFVLKGSGWYATDYPSSDRKKALDAESPKKETKPEQGCSAGACASDACPTKG